MKEAFLKQKVQIKNKIKNIINFIKNLFAIYFLGI